jgi:probable rRNA maturation factor
VITILVEDQFQDQLDDQVLCQAAELTLQLCGISDSPSLSIRITDDLEIQELNKRYRGLDQPTDVLSFAADFEDPDLGSRYLGDVVISFPQASAQALDRGHLAIEEVQLLVIHGVLHLVGFDHGTKSEKEAMWSFQEKILTGMGLDIQVEERQTK